MMKILLFFSFLIKILQSTSAITNTTQNNHISSNNVKTTVDKLTPDIRSVLLQAIDKLEKEAAESNDHDDENDENNNNNHSLSSLTGTESSNLIPTVQFYTASSEDASQDISPEGDIILKTIFKNTASKELDADDIKIHFAAPTTRIPKNKSKNNQQTRSVSSNEISNDKKSEFITPTTIRPKLHNIRHRISTVSTTTTTTTTKKPAPTHNEDGENIELVEKKDIKILKAPLVTAFSVQQDDRGTLKNVIPLLNDATVTTTTINPIIKPLISGGAVIEKLKVTATNVSNILLSTPSPIRRITTSLPPTQNSISNEPKGIPVPSFLRSEVFKSNSIVKSNEVPILPIEQQQNLFSAQQALPIAPNLSNSNSNNKPFSEALINNYLLERQRFLEQQILQLQIQARQQQEQIILQQRLLEEQRRAKLEEQRNSGFKNQPQLPLQQQISPSLSIPDHLQPRTRHFRQENGVGNFGANAFFNSESSARFQRNGFSPESQSQNLIFQPALNHGISPFTTTQNFRFSAPGQFTGSF